MKMLTKAELNTIDRNAGLHLRIACKDVGLSQVQLAEKCGITFQQIQKYMNGANRMSVSRLYQIAEILEKPIWFFFPESCGGDMAKYALRFEQAISRYRDKEDRILQILTEK